MSDYIPTWMQSWSFEEPIIHSVYKNGLIFRSKQDPGVMRLKKFPLNLAVLYLDENN